MTWVRLDDKFWRNKKMHEKMSFAARGLWVDALSYCADTPDLTGFLSFREARERGPKHLIAELVRENAWEQMHDGYLIHDFELYIERGSRDRCRAWRERKRAESDRHRNVTETSPRATGLETISTSGLYPFPSRPEPGPDGDGGEPVENRLGNGYGIPETSMHVDGLHDVSKILGGLVVQPVGRRETA